MKNILSILILTLLASTSQAIKFVTYYAYDQVGNPIAAIDETQGVIATRDTLAYGSEQTHTGNAAAFGDLGFTGQIDRSNNQIVYFNARYYLPQLRRFASPDSVTVVDGGFKHIDRYSYAYANPYLYNDPTGNSPAHLLAAGVGFAMGFGATMIGSNWGWDNLGSAFVNGAIGAGVGLATMGVGLIPAMGISGTGGLASEVYKDGFDLGMDNAKSVGLSMLSGGLGAQVGKLSKAMYAGKGGAYDKLGTFNSGNSVGIYSMSNIFETAAGGIASGTTNALINYDYLGGSSGIGYSLSDQNYTYSNSYNYGYGSSSIIYNNYGDYSAGYNW